MARFQNYLNDVMTDDAVEPRVVAMRVVGEAAAMTTRHFIKMGFAGFNSRANNGNGYATKAKAEAAILDYQNRR